jgi:hypothetical protein
MIGLVRLLALIVNGTFADSIYARWSPHVRGVCAFLSCGIWFPLWAGFFAVSGAPIVKLFTFTVLAIDAYNVRRVGGCREDIQGICRCRPILNGSRPSRPRSSSQ